MSRVTFQETSIKRVQTYWDDRPCNIRHSPQPVGTREYFDEVETRKYFVEPHILRFAEFERWRGKRVLEIGCGIGTDTVNFARCAATVTAVDLSAKSLEVARARAGVYGLGDGVRFYQANAEELTSVVPVEPYDLIYSFGVIHHTPHPEPVIEQMRSFARSGTIVKIMVYHRRSWKVLTTIMREGKGRFWRLDEQIARHSEAQTGCPVTYTYSRREGRALLERHGFKVTGMWVDHIFPYRVRDYLQYRYRKVWYFGMMPPPLFHWFERRAGWHLCITGEAS